MVKIIIVGAGISGLSCALELINRGYEVEIYESTSTFGGQAKSVETNTCYIPYAWRIWSNYYYNFLELTSNIPYKNGTTIRDNLVPIPNYSHELKGGIGRQVAGGLTLDIKKFPSKWSYLRLVLKLVQAFTFSDERLRKNDITFFDYIDPKDQATINFIDELVGPILGMEARKTTLFCVIKGWQVTYMSESRDNNFEKLQIYVANGPYSEVLFNPWAEHLISKGVIIHKNTRVTGINYDKNTNKIISMSTDTKGTVYGDDFVLCIDQSAVNKLLRHNDDLMRDPMIKNSTKLREYGNNLWFGMVLYFSEKFLPEIGTGCTQDQPWKVVLENFSASWKPEFIKQCGVAEIVQVSVLDLVLGTNGKYLRDCSVEEAVQETLLQLQRSDLMKNLKTETGKNAFETLCGYDVWPDWVNDENGKIINKSGQYKLSINSKCWENMPDNTTSIDNLFFGSVIVKADAPMVSMEFACTNGRSAAQVISKKYGTEPVKVLEHKGYFPTLMEPLRGMDKILYKSGLNINIFQVIATLLIFIFLVICVMIFIYIKKYLINRSKIHIFDVIVMLIIFIILVICVSMFIHIKKYLVN